MAVLCINKICYPALVSNETPTGEYILIQRLVSDPFYAGSVIQFKETDKLAYSIHRIWRGKPSEKRDERINSNNVQDRFITNGCINVTDEVYNKLLDCCQNEQIKIYP